MVARVVWDHEAAGSSPVTSTIQRSVRTYVLTLLFLLYRIFYRTLVKIYAPLLSRYSVNRSSTLPPCFQAAKPVPV